MNSAIKKLKKVKGIGPKRLENITAKLNDMGKTVDDLFAMPAADIVKQFRLPKNIARAIAAPQKVEAPREQSQDDKLTAKNIKVIHIDDDLYPAKLKKILGKKAPATLCVWGNLELLNKPAIGFCGSRNVSEKGLEVTADTAEQITKQGWVVISGHARGVDTTAHLTALEKGGSTIVVLPEGILEFKLRRELKKIAKPEQILIISEFKPSARWNVGYAMQRNNTIVALSDAMILVEARDSGGTFAAGETALRLKVPLYVVEYQMPGESAAGNVHFLKKGATAILKGRETGRANIEALCQRVSDKYKISPPPVSEETPKEQLPLFQTGTAKKIEPKVEIPV